MKNNWFVSFAKSCPKKTEIDWILEKRIQTIIFRMLNEENLWGLKYFSNEPLYLLILPYCFLQPICKILAKDSEKGDFMTPSWPILGSGHSQKAPIPFDTFFISASIFSSFMSLTNFKFSKLSSTGKDSAIDNVAFPLVAWTKRKWVS